MLFATWLTKCDFALWFSLLFSWFLYSAPITGFVLDVHALQVFIIIIMVIIVIVIIWLKIKRLFGQWQGVSYF